MPRAVPQIHYWFCEVGPWPGGGLWVHQQTGGWDSRTGTETGGGICWAKITSTPGMYHGSTLSELTAKLAKVKIGVLSLF